MATYVVRVARQATVFLLFLLTIVLGAVSGVLFAFAGDLPQISALDDYAPSTITRIYASNGDVVGEFAKERRLVVGYDGISPLLRQAIIAAEDKDFEEHVGLSLPRIVITAVKDVVHQQRAGASTITQQLARMLFLQSDYMRGGVYARTGVAGWERKIKEAIISVQLEKRYTKREILTLYCNATYFGHGAYGVEAASRLYFGKAARDLALEEAALIAGIIQGNVRQSPYINPEAATPATQLRAAADGRRGIHHAGPGRAPPRRAPIKTAGLPTQQYSPAPYFVEEVRQQLEARFGAKQLYENGLSVQTTLDLPLQQAATRALQAGLRRLDQRRGFRKPTNLLAAGADLDAYRHPRWQGPMQVGDVVPAVVTGTTATEIQARAGRLDVRIPKAGFQWTGKATASALVARGDAGAGADRASRGRRPHGRGPPRPGTGTAGRRRRARQPHRAHPRDGGRLRLRPQQVQPRHPGVTAARLDVQAGGLHRGDRSRLHAREHAARRAGVVPGRRRLARRTRRSTTTVSSRGRSRCVARSSSRATCRPCA